MPRKSLVLLVLSLAVAPVVAACGGSQTGGGSASLSATSWRLVELGGSEPAGDAKPTLVFAQAGGTVSGNSGCNTFNGSVTIDGDSIEFGPLATTRMACPEPAMSLETAYLAALDGATTWRIDGSQLILDGTTTLTFDEA
jgi:heat shock protein HslJ